MVVMVPSGIRRACDGVVMAVVGYQNLVTVPVLRSEVAVAQAPQILNPVYFTAGTNRSENQVTVTTKRNRPFTLTVDIPAESRFTSYVCELQSPSGELEGSLTISAEAAKNSVSMSMYPKHGNSGTLSVGGFRCLAGRGTESCNRAPAFRVADTAVT